MVSSSQSSLKGKPDPKCLLTKKLGILVNSMSFGQMSVFLSDALNQTRDVAGTVFFENQGSPNYICNFAMMDLSYAWDFNAPLIATSMSTASKLVDMPTNHQRYFYVWDLEWVRLSKKNYQQLQSVYGNKKLKLFARSEDHRAAIKNAWNRDSIIVDDFDMDTIKRELWH